MSGVDCGKVHRGMVCTRPLGHKGMHRRRVAVESERERCLLRDTDADRERLREACHWRNINQSPYGCQHGGVLPSDCEGDADAILVVLRADGSPSDRGSDAE